MALLRLQNIELAFGHHALLDGVNMTIERGERICLIGRNGAGKSTLLKVIQGSQPADSGERVAQGNTVITQLEQEIPQDIDGTVFNVVAGGMANAGKLLSEYHELSLKPDTDGWLKKLERLQQQLEQQNGWQLQQQVETVISRLALPPEASFTELSGGLKRRVLLARALLQKPDILLLDEPTNHLDIEAIEWLEEFLAGFRGAILFITHDRTFLRKLANRIIELDRGRIISFPGNYDQYLQRKEEMLAAEAVENANFDKKLAQEESWIRQGIKARRTRNEGRVRALKKMREERRQRREQQGTARLNLETANQSGKLVAEASDIAFSYVDKPVFKAFSTTIQRGDKIGILGPNGVGKTTLLRVLLGQLPPSSGSIRPGTNIELAYFDQLRSQLDENKNVRDNLDHGSDQITVNGKQKHVISYLQDFLFSPERIHSPVSTLSGGERNRLLLARLFLKPANVLVMDEPTNDLDVETLELLEELLLDYRGTLLLVSHDRSFINNIVTSTLVFEGNALVNEYIGGYDDWLRQRPARTSSGQTQEVRKKTPQAQQPGMQVKAAKPVKLGYKDQRELDALPGKIEELENSIAAMHETMGSTAFYQQDATRITAAQDELAALEADLARAYERWEFLESL